MIFDGQGKVPGRSADGVITMGKKDWIVLDGVRVINSNWTGIAARGCSNITVQNCSTKNTLASGIYIRASTDVKVLSNKVQQACVHPVSTPRKDTQEGISLVGCTDFEIAYNEVFDRLEDTNNGGEGIDTKEACRNGKVHHNHVHDLVRLASIATLSAASWRTSRFSPTPSTIAGRASRSPARRAGPPAASAFTTT